MQNYSRLMIAALLLLTGMTTPAMADLLPELPPEPQAPILPTPFQSIVAGIFLTTAIVTGSLVMLARTHAENPKRFLKVGILSAFAGGLMSLLLIGGSFAEHSRYDSQMEIRESQIEANRQARIWKRQRERVYRERAQRDRGRK